MALPAAAAAIDPYLLHARPTAAKAPHTATAGEWDRQTGEQMDGHFTDSALHTIQTMPKSTKYAHKA